MTAQPLVFQLNDRVGTLTFSRPKELNAVNLDMARAMGELTRKLPGVEGLQAIVLRGSGNHWLGREGSNLRMAESKSAALPLGDAPIVATL